MNPREIAREATGEKTNEGLQRAFYRHGNFRVNSASITEISNMLTPRWKQYSYV